MKRFIIIISALLLLCSCGMKNGQSNLSNDEDLNSVIENYFKNFNNVYKWSEFASDDYIKRVYMWCSGDDSESKTISEMKDLYYEISKERAKIIDYKFTKLNEINEEEYELSVDRSWDNGENDSTTYSILKINNLWKFDNRF